MKLDELARSIDEGSELSKEEILAALKSIIRWRRLKTHIYRLREIANDSKLWAPELMDARELTYTEGRLSAYNECLLIIDKLIEEIEDVREQKPGRDDVI